TIAGEPAPPSGFDLVTLPGTTLTQGTQLNNVPTDIALSGSSVTASTAGAVVGAVSAVDADAGDVHTWSVSDARFEVTNGQLRVKASQMLPSSPGTVSVTLTATDIEGLSFSKTFTLSVLTPVVLSAGALDPTFGSSGKVITPVGSGGSVAFALARQPDGKLVTAGYAWNQGSLNGMDFALARYNSNGTLDTTFGTNGKVTTNLGFADDLARAVAVQPDGKILAAGAAWDGQYSDLALARYNSNGTLDTTFGTNGRVVMPIGSGEDYAAALVVQPDGKILVAGTATDEWTAEDFTLVRFNSDGTLDSTFGSAGVVTTNFDFSGSSFSSDVATSLVLQPDGKLIAAGRTVLTDWDNNATTRVALARYTPNGTLDATFGSGGILTTSIGAGDDSISALALQPDGKLVAAGRTSNGSEYDFALIRYTPSGTLDSTFGSSGVVTTDLGGTDTASALALQPDGKLVAVGQTYNGVSWNFALARYATSGTLDSTFGSSGKVTTSIGAVYDSATALVLEPDGKIVAAGQTNNGTNSSFVLTRYLP
ncbi:delta-60 repeat domain-containing protein, partial [Deinococcus yavapaiensis]